MSKEREKNFTRKLIESHIFKSFRIFLRPFEAFSLFIKIPSRLFLFDVNAKLWNMNDMASGQVWL